MGYDDIERKSTKITITLKTYQVGGKDTCLGWAGDEEHEQEKCPFLGSRTFGTKFVCMVNGEDLNFNEVIKPSPNCFLRKQEDKDD